MQGKSEIRCTDCRKQEGVINFVNSYLGQQTLSLLLAFFVLYQFYYTSVEAFLPIFLDTTKKQIYKCNVLVAFHQTEIWQLRYCRTTYHICLMVTLPKVECSKEISISVKEMGWNDRDFRYVVNLIYHKLWEYFSNHVCDKQHQDFQTFAFHSF